MLAKIAPASNDFFALARYLVHGKGAQPDPKRVAWVASQNLGTDDPELIAKLMTGTAGLSTRTRKAVYHMMIAWHERERPTPELMQEIAFQTLARAGLSEHQVLIMGHSDKPHPHLHMMINRVHPETGRAWDNKNDFARFDKIMRELSETYGFEFVPAHAYNREETDEKPKAPKTRPFRAAQRGANTGRSQWSRRTTDDVSESLSEDLTLASTPEDVLLAFGDHGLQLEPKGRGFIVGNSVSYTKLSQLRLSMTARASPLLDAAVAALYPQPPTRRRVFDVDEVDITRAFIAIGLLDRTHLTSAVEAVKERRARETKIKRVQGTHPLNRWRTDQLTSNAGQQTLLFPLSPSPVLSNTATTRSRTRRPLQK